MRTLLILMIYLSLVPVMGQITLVVDTLPAGTPESAIIYVAGDFQGWDPGHPEYVLTRDENGSYHITLDSLIPGTVYHYKFTQGSWETVEKSWNGKEIENRTFEFGKDRIQTASIQGWALAEDAPLSTASWNVALLSEDFYMPQLDRYRRIWVYFPPGYDSTTMRYPVIYMHDGQNLFDNLTAYSGEWGVDETLNRLASLGYRVPLVIGIDNGGIARINEMSPWQNPEYGGGEGDAYIDFIASTLKPWVDSTFRTHTGSAGTALAGSSLGGLISCYGTLKYPGVFGRCGALSPAYWFVKDSLLSAFGTLSNKDYFRIYQNSGTLEEEKNIQLLGQMESALLQTFSCDVHTTFIEGGQHDEQTWQQDFGQAYLWLFGAWANAIKKEELVWPVLLTYSPDHSMVTIKNRLLSETDKISLTHASLGKIKPAQYTPADSTIILREPDRGLYLLKIKRGKQQYLGRFRVD